MITRNLLLVLGSSLLMPLFSAVPAQAQRVNADIMIGGGPIAGRVIIGDRGRDGYRGRPRPVRGVEWVRARDYRRDDWWRRFQSESRVVVVYWDRNDDHYYFDRDRSDLLETRIYERGGRYYRLEDDGYGFEGRYDSRYNDRSYGRYDDRYDNRSNGRYDNRYGNQRRDDRRWNNDRDNRRDGKGDKDKRRGNDRRGNDRANYDR